MDKEKNEEELERILTGKLGAEMKIKKAFSQVEEPYSVLVLIESSNYFSTRNELLRANKEKEILYITFNSSPAKITEEMKKEKIPAKINFVDLSSTKNENSLSPTELTEALMEIEEKAPKKGLVIVDSVTSILVYNSAESTEKFAHSLIGRINKSDSSLILLSSDAGKTEKITTTISHFTDKTITL